MNREVGWRRLNVLVTRAKLSTRLFTSLRPDDVKVTPTSSRGVRTFKDYLTYAHGGASYTDASGGEPDSDFEVFVAEALDSAGYEVVHQVGVEGFRIDLGVRHADYPNGFIAGIECDGASFHRGLTVRDRDRIRQSVLEAMGWKIYRIWSTDWFADPARERERLLAFLGECRAAFAAGDALRPEAQLEGPRAAVEIVAQDQLEAFEPTQAIVQPTPTESAGSGENAGPNGRAMRSLDGIEWYETEQARLYEVWSDHCLAGEVEVISRALGSPKLYGDRTIVARSEYEGRVARTSERFRNHDIHAAVREVARRAREATEASSNR
jgi:very-short-patch-repair endonuclease